MRVLDDGLVAVEQPVIIAATANADAATLNASAVSPAIQLRRCRRRLMSIRRVAFAEQWEHSVIQAFLRHLDLIGR